MPSIPSLSRTGRGLRCGLSRAGRVKGNFKYFWPEFIALDQAIPTAEMENTLIFNLEKECAFEKTLKEGEMGEKSSFPYRKYDRKPHPYIVKQILEDHDLMEMMKEVLIHEGKSCPFCHRKLKGEQKEREIW